MSKSILVIDTPGCCRECPVCASYAESAFSPREYWCTVSENTNVYPHDKPDWCPLKPIPKEQTVRPDYRCDWELGYNSCLHEILGGQQ